MQRDQTVISFKNPKVQASIQANTYVVSGQATTKRIEDMLPNFGMNMGGGAPDMATLQQLLAKMGAAPGGMPKVPTIEVTFGALCSPPRPAAVQVAHTRVPANFEDSSPSRGSQEEGDEDVPDLVENFEAETK